MRSLHLATSCHPVIIVAIILYLEQKCLTTSCHFTLTSSTMCRVVEDGEEECAACSCDCAVLLRNTLHVRPTMPHPLSCSSRVSPLVLSFRVSLLGEVSPDAVCWYHREMKSTISKTNVTHCAMTNYWRGRRRARSLGWRTRSKRIKLTLHPNDERRRIETTRRRRHFQQQRFPRLQAHTKSAGGDTVKRLVVTKRWKGASALKHNEQAGERLHL